MQCAFDEKSQKKLDRSNNLFPEEILTRLTPEQAQAQCYRYRSCTSGGVFYPEGGWVCPHELTKSLFTLAKNTGLCTLYCNQNIEEIEQEGTTPWSSSIQQKQLIRPRLQ